MGGVYAGLGDAPGLDVNYITRAEWGAAAPTSPCPRWSAGQPTGIAIHYVGGSGTIGDADHAQCYARLRNLQAYATSGHYTWTYSDIEYNLAACRHGYVFEARGIDVQGAAQMNANSDHASVLALANVDDPIDGPLATAVNDAVAFFQSHYPLATEVVGHRDTAGNPTGTNCPGDMIEAWIRAGRPGTPTPPVPEATEVTATVIVNGVANTFDPRPSDGHVIQIVTGRKAFDVSAAANVSAADKFVGPLNAFVEAGEVVVRGPLADGSVGELRYAGNAWHAAAYR